MNSNLKDRYMGILLLLFGAVLMFSIPKIIQGASNVTTLGPRFFPQFIAIAIIILSAILIIKSFLNNAKEKEKNPEKEGSKFKKEEAMVGVWVFVVMLFYVFIVQWVSFLPATIVAMAVIMMLMRVKKWYHYLIVIALIVLIKYIFASLIFVPLP